jgi:hypothetical protein
MAQGRARANRALDSDIVALIQSEIREELSGIHQKLMVDVDKRIEDAAKRFSVAGVFRQDSPRYGGPPPTIRLQPMSARNSNSNDPSYTALKPARLVLDTEVSACNGFGEIDTSWEDEWMETVEAGELDVYTCLGLSNAFTNTPDTRKIWLQATAVTVLQLVVPVLMLFSEWTHGLTVQPDEGDPAYRFIGAVLYAYSVYTMHNNADGTSRSSLLNMMSRYHDVPAGYWAPLVIGELLNALVAIILVLTLFQIYCHQRVPADLILNAVAVNFLGSVDSEFVDPGMSKDAIANFKQFSADYFKQDALKGQRSNSSGQVQTSEHTSGVDWAVRLVLYGVIVAGFIGSLTFLVSPTMEHHRVIGKQSHMPSN